MVDFCGSFAIILVLVLVFTDACQLDILDRTIGAGAGLQP